MKTFINSGLVGIIWILMVSCTQSKPLSPETQKTQAINLSTSPTHVESKMPLDRSLLLSLAQFNWKIDENGKKKPIPGPAKLILLEPTLKTWRTSVLQDPESSVFHKALCVTTQGTKKILTIGGTDALLKLWSVKENKWTSETLWNPKFGGKWDRLRDFEIADLDGDQKVEIVIATHDQGVIVVAKQNAHNKWDFKEVSRNPSTFVHEIEIGDVDGDGKKEFYATPSKPNKADKSQSGKIVAFVQNGSQNFTMQDVVHFDTSHAKEILVTDINGDGRDELYTAVEAARGHKKGVTHPVEIREYFKNKKGQWRPRVITTLPGAVQSRFLLTADLTHKGQKEIIVTTMKGGLWRLIPPLSPKETWQKVLIDAESGGYEHAAQAADLDGDGKYELYVAADDQDEVRCYKWDGKNFKRETIYTLDRSDITWGVVDCTPTKLN